MTKLQTELRPARYTVSSRDIDDEHRPRIVRFAAADQVYRPRPSPVASAVRRSTSGPLLFTAALAGVGICFLMSSLLREPPEIASATALNSMPLRPAESLLVDHIVLEMPTAPAVIVSDHQRRGLASEWSNSTSSGTLDDQVAIAGATEIPATGGPQPVPGLGADSATGTLQAPIAPNESPSADESAAKSRRSPVVGRSAWRRRPKSVTASANCRAAQLVCRSSESAAGRKDAREFAAKRLGRSPPADRAGGSARKTRVAGGRRSRREPRTRHSAVRCRAPCGAGLRGHAAVAAVG